MAVIHDADGTPVWNTGAYAGNDGLSNKFVLRDDGELFMQFANQMSFWQLSKQTTVQYPTQDNEGETYIKIMPQDTSLLTGDSLVSENGKFRLMLQKDGSFALSKKNNQGQFEAIWTCPKKATKGRICLETDSKWQFYDANNQVVWTGNKRPIRTMVNGLQPMIFLQNNGNIYINYTNLIDRSEGTLWNLANKHLIRRPATEQQTKMYFGKIHNPATLLVGDTLWSNNQNYCLSLDTNQGLVVSEKIGDTAYTVIWASNTPIRAEGGLIFQDNGSLSLYESDSLSVWTSDKLPDTNLVVGYKLVLNDYGSLRIENYSGMEIIRFC
jgi:hypothetical protein